MAQTIYENGEWVPAHWHHIIPVHTVGTDDPENLVLLSIPNHAEAHRILFEKYGRWQDKIAWKGLAGMIGKEEIIHQICVEAKTGENNPMYRKNHSPEAKEKMRIRKLGRKRSPETKEKIRISNTGENHPMYGKHPSPETIEKMRISNLKNQYTIQCPSGKIVIMLSMRQFCLENGLDQGAMAGVANGKRPHHKGYKVLEKLDIQCPDALIRQKV